ncbi:hypothetical protein Leryth_004606 [Lithospermum erythrorhizon]|nr:hypothetical protein Leryth_004606 [Lithospermum erythrorhizon]
MEYARWLEDDHRHMSELRAALQPVIDADQLLLMAMLPIMMNSSGSKEWQLKQIYSTLSMVCGLPQLNVASFGWVVLNLLSSSKADNLRQQTLHQLQRILTVRQATRCFLVIGEFYGRLRALSSLWASRPEGS